jgi:hypothetical protein
LFARTIDNLPDGGVFGLVVPQLVLNGKGAKTLRDRLLKQFEISEICLLPDKVFENSSVETAVLLGRKRPPSLRTSICYRRVREWDMSAFIDRLEASTEVRVPQSSFLLSADSGLRLADLQDVWESLKNFSRLGENVEIRKGFEFKSKVELDGRIVESVKRRPGWRQALLRADDDYAIWGLPTTAWIDYSRETLRERGGGAKPGHPQVLVNYAPTSRKPWRLKATIDPVGLPVASRFISFRPKRPDLTLDILWAILNSPVANAFAFAISGKRQTLPKEWRQFPIPKISPQNAAAITEAAHGYREAAKSKETAFFSGPDDIAVRQALLAMDAEVLRVYALTPMLERQLLALFEGVHRSGVSCRFIGYPLGGEAPQLPFHLRLKLGRYHDLATAKLAGRLSSRGAVELAEIKAGLDAYEIGSEGARQFRAWLRTVDRRNAATRTKLEALEARVLGRRNGAFEA